MLEHVIMLVLTCCYISVDLYPAFIFMLVYLLQENTVPRDVHIQTMDSTTLVSSLGVSYIFLFFNWYIQHTFRHVFEFRRYVPYYYIRRRSRFLHCVSPAVYSLVVFHLLSFWFEWNLVFDYRKGFVLVRVSTPFTCTHRTAYYLRANSNSTHSYFPYTH